MEPQDENNIPIAGTMRFDGMVVKMRIQKNDQSVREKQKKSTKSLFSSN